MRCRRGLGRVAVVASRCLRQSRTYLEDDLFANLHGSRFRATRLGDVASSCARDGHEPSRARLTMIRGYCCGALQRRAVGIISRACPKEDVTARHTPDVEPPIVGLSDVEAESVVISICTAGQDLPPSRQGILDQSDLIVWVSGICSNHVLWLGRLGRVPGQVPAHPAATQPSVSLAPDPKATLGAHVTK